jgi:outer membrane protein TolC
MISFLLMGYTGCIQPDHMHIFQPTFPNVLDTDIKHDTLIEKRQQPIQLPVIEKKLNLSIEESVMYALANNKSLYIEQLQPIISGTFDQIERGVYDLEIFVNASYARNREKEISSDQENITDEKDMDLSLGLRQSLPYGTKVEMAIEKNHKVNSNDPDPHKAGIKLSITQSLLNGYGSVVNLANIKMAELDTMATQYELFEYTQSLVAKTEIAYWQYVLAKQKTNICKESLAIAKKQRKEIKQQISIGLLPTNEAFAAHAEVALRKQALLDAQNLIVNRRLHLLKLITIHPNHYFDIQIIPNSQPNLKITPLTDLNDRIKLAEKLRPDLNEARLRLKQRRLETIVTRNGILPKLELFIVMGNTGYADSFSESFKHIDDTTYDAAVGMQFSHYLGNRAANSRYYGAQLKRQQALTAIANLRKIVHFDVRLAFNDLAHAHKQISATHMTLKYQRQTAKAEKDRFSVGASTALMVSQVYRDLLAAQNAKIEAIVNYRIALIKLYVAEGSLLERRGFSVMGEKKGRL